MPLVAHSPLPTFDGLRADGEPVLTVADARAQDIRELHIGLLNMMPDAALTVTEQQFMRLVGSANPIVHLWVHPFTVPGLERSPDTQAYIDAFYTPFDDLREAGLDALIVSGANVTNPYLEDEPFWRPLLEVVEWAVDNVTSVLCSCLATHALVQRFYGVHRRRLLNKRWGVYGHCTVAPGHPLLRGTNTRFDVPHSRWNAITSAQLERVGVRVLIESLEGDFHLGTSADGFRMIYMQGHPEYDAVSLLKEYKRNIPDMEAIAEMAHRRGIPVIVDNTVATPSLIKPIEWGADIVVHSLTKYMGGHGTTLGGIIVDGGRFPWAEHAQRFPMLNEPEPSYHGVVYTEALGAAAFVGRARTVPLRNTGSAISPLNAWLILQGIETLSLRMERHTENAAKVAEYLTGHEFVEWVEYAGLPGSQYYEMAQKYTGGRPSALLSFGVKGGYEAGVKAHDALELFTRLVNIGDTKSLVVHPASTTHRQLSEEELATAGVTPDMVRLCVGIEHIDDILGDLEQALKASRA